ncbi:MAG: response regulator transcription factor [Tannerellaceae bacterium]|jgi:DNA-binding response OmpR family regulator|nr:response regulator transcription factor [Tannerellaceae bacterium]
METQASNTHILIVDDEPDIREILQFNLENEGYHTDMAASAEEALSLLSPRHRLILLDVMMSKMSGFKMADMIRKDGNQIPIIFLTARKAENDMLTGFSIGGDDYISKPFSIKEVIARVKSVLKRGGTHKPVQHVLQAGGIALNTRTKTLLVDNCTVEITRTEYNILLLMLKHEGEFLTRTDILDNAWSNEGIVLERTVDVHITRLRKKLGRYSDCIVTRTGHGYMFSHSENHPHI